MYSPQKNYEPATAPTLAHNSLNTFEQGKVVEYLKLVKWIVSRLLNRLPRHIEADDLVHSGILGLMDAVKKFSWGRPKQEEEFKAYAEVRIRGQIMDELRRLDMLPRSAREKVNRFKKAYEELRQHNKREPSDQEICQKLGIDIETCHRLKAEMSFGKEISYDTCQIKQGMEEMLLRTLDEVSSNTPEAHLHVEEVKKILAQEIENLEEKEQQIISLYYLEEMTLKEIGYILSVTESRISQIHAQAMTKLLKKLRAALGMDFPILS